MPALLLRTCPAAPAVRTPTLHRRYTRKSIIPAAKPSLASITWFVPDISPAVACDKAAAAAAWEAVKDMPLTELGLRGAAEAGAAFAVAALAVGLLARAAAAADAHSDRVEEEEGSAAGAAARVGDAPPPTRSTSWFTLAADAAVGAALRPARVLAPLAAAAQAARTAALVLQILLRKAAVGGARSGGPAGAAAAAAADRVGGLLAAFDAVALDAVQLAAIAGCAWFAVAWKDRLVALALRLAARSEAAPPPGAGAALAKGLPARPSTNGVDGLERILVPFAGLASWAIIATAAVGCATALGVDVRPLLTVGGVGGLALGFGVQTVTSNAIAGLTLYLTRPFVVGERVTLQTPSGAAVVTGVVERIDPMRTLIRSDRAAPVSIPNKSLADFMVVNESRIRASPVLTGFNDPRQFAMTVDVRHEDLEKVREREGKEGGREGWNGCGWRGRDGLRERTYLTTTLSPSPSHSPFTRSPPSRTASRPTWPRTPPSTRPCPTGRPSSP